MNVVQSLIAQYGVSAEQFDHQGNTPLHYAASSKVIGAVHLVKCLVNEYHVSVTVKNGAGKTAYDIATQDSIRQYLLPIQLQRETQECIDNGGRGLPDGIDMGGMNIKRDIAPPPIVGGFGSSPPMGGYSAAGLGTSKYAVPAFGQQVHSPSQMQQPVNMAVGGFPAAPAAAYGFAQPQPHGHNQYPPQPQQPQPMPFNDATAVAQPIPGPTNTPDKPVPVQSYATPDAVSPAPLSSEPMVAPTVNTVNATANVGASSEPIPDEKPKDIPITAQDQTVPATTAPAAQVAPVQPAPFSYGSSPAAAASSYYGATSSPATAPAAVTTTQPPGTTSAPSSGNGYAMRGFSSAAVLPKNSKYKPDGFHSSSSDVSLQKKYGHDSSITGPPSGNYNSSSIKIAPPPSATSGGSGGAATGGGGSGYNPYASSTTFGASPAMARPRYPTYDAVSDTVGMASSGGNANAGGYGYNPYGATAAAAPAQGQYNVYTPQQQQQYQQPAYDYSQQQQQQYQQPAYDYSQQQQQQYQQQPANDYSQQQQVTNASPWKAAMSPEGQTYYYNEVTSETTWDMPAEMQYQQSAVANQTSPVEVQAQPAVGVNANAAVDPTGIQGQTSPVANQTSPIATEEPRSVVQSAETAPVVQEPLKMQESAPSLVEQPLVTPTSQQTQSFFGSTPQPNEFTPVAANPVSAVNEQMQYMNVGGGPVRQTSTASASATDLFGTPPVGANTGTASAAGLFSPGSPSDVKPEVNQAFEDANDSDDSLAPPPIATEDHFPVGDNLPLEGEGDDDFLPPPPFGESSNDNDQSGQDEDLPPPPMMEISLS